MIFSCASLMLKKTPKFVCLLLTIVNIVMIFFVINGATHDSAAYNSLYLYQYKFNNSSDISHLLASQYSTQHKGKNLEDFVMSVGFMGVCLEFGGDEDTLCGYTDDMQTQYEKQVPSFSVTNNKNTTSGANLELFGVAKTFQHTVKKHILIVELVALLLLLVTQLYNMIGFLPFQFYVQMFIFVVIACYSIIMLISISWVMITCQDLKTVGGPLTMNILSFSKGTKPVGILWAAFALAIVQVAFYVWICLSGEDFLQRFGCRGRRTDAEKEAGSINNSVLSSITTLRGTL